MASMRAARFLSLIGNPTLEKPILDLAIHALTKFGVKVTEPSFEKAYNEGRTTQVPTGAGYRRWCGGAGALSN